MNQIEKLKKFKILNKEQVMDINAVKKISGGDSECADPLASNHWPHCFKLR